MTTVVNMMFGSRVYGTAVPTSDYDYKEIFLPSAKDIVMGTVKDAYNQSTKKNLLEKNTQNDVETEFFSLKKYLTLLTEGQTVALDMLFCGKEHYQGSPHYVWDIIQENKQKFFSSKTLAFVGYCRQQSSRYGQKGSRVASVRETIAFLTTLTWNHPQGHLTRLKDVWEDIEKFVTTHKEHIAIVTGSVRGQADDSVRFLEVCNRKVQEHVSLKEAIKIFTKVFEEYGQRALLAEKNEGIDWKALSHAVRICEQAKEFLLTGSVTFPRPEAELLLQIRKGELSYKEVAELIEVGMDELLVCQSKSILPPEPDLKFRDELVLEIYTKIVKGVL